MNTNTQEITRNRINVKEIVVTALFIALTYVFTAFINIKLPFAGQGGLIHLGNVPLFVAAIIFGKRTGCIAGAVGMGLFDLLSGWVSWAPFTFIIVGLMGLAVGFITEKESHKKIFWYIIAMIAACAIKVVGYYFAEVILYGNWITPFSSIPGNLIQVATAAIIVLVIITQLLAVARKTGIIYK